jgi:hypothetical protein
VLLSLLDESYSRNVSYTPNYISMFLLLIILTGLEQRTYIAIGAGSGVALILLVVLVVMCLRFVKISCSFDV